MKFEEFTYISENPNHAWKRVDVAMLLLGIFNEDIQMFCIRNPNYNIVEFIPGLMELTYRSSRLQGTNEAKP